MSNILLAGDSWGIGVFAGVGENYGPTGQGIQSILEESGHKVINISQAGDNNTNIFSRIKNTIEPTDYIFFLQTDIFREHSYHVEKNGVGCKTLESAFIDKLIEYPTLSAYFDQYFLNLYANLNSLNKKIYCVGGWSKLHPCISKFENLVGLIPSATEFIIPDIKDVYVSDFEYFIQLSNNKEFVDKFDIEFKELLLESSKKVETCCKYWNDVHPNLLGYQKIVEVLAKIF